MIDWVIICYDEIVIVIIIFYLERTKRITLT